ncbi:MAG: hypothetical protein WCV72_00300 [Patescibacteria group bacterium]
MHCKTPPQKCFGIATIVFTITTALILLTAIWVVRPEDHQILGQLIATSITFAAFSFVFFLVTTFWKK